MLFVVVSQLSLHNRDTKVVSVTGKYFVTPVPVAEADTLSERYSVYDIPIMAMILCSRIMSY